MNLPRFSVRRSVAATMMILIVVVLGGISLVGLPVELMPELTFPTASIITGYEGAASEDIQTLVTKPIEQAVSMVKNIKTVRSISQEGVSIVSAEFEWGTNVDFAAQDIRDGIGILREYLPPGIDDPIIVKFDLSLMPVLVYGITGERDSRSLRTLVEDRVKDRIEMVDGVATTMIMGGRQREIQVRIDRQKLEALNLSFQQIVTLLRYGNLNLSGGHVTDGHAEYVLRTLGQFENLDEIRNTVVTVVNGAPVHLSDVADVADTHTEIRNRSRINGKSGVLLAVIKQSGANTLDVVNAVKRRVDELKKDLPPDINFHVCLDQGKFTELMGSNLAESMFWGGVLAVVILFLALRDWRPTLTVALAIPLSIMAVFIPLHYLGYTLNITTVGGLALGVGMLVSNAIIVIENTFRHLEEGKKRDEAAIAGTSEVAAAITASTLTTIAVFFPLTFIYGIAGRVSRGFAVTITFSLLASLFVALTLVPMISSKILRRRKGKGERAHAAGRGFAALAEWYSTLLAWALRHRLAVLVSAVLLFGGGLALMPFMGREFMPPTDIPLVVLKVEMPVGTDLAETDRVVRQVERILMSEEGVDVVGTFTGVLEGTMLDVAFGGGAIGSAGVNEAQVFASLRDKGKRRRSSIEIQDSVRSRLPQLKGASIEIVDLARFMVSGGMAGVPVEVKIFGKDVSSLEKVAGGLAAGLRSVEGLHDVNTTASRGKPELRFKIDRVKASQLGFSTAQVASAMRAAFQGVIATRYREGGDEFDLRVKFRDEDSARRRDVAEAVIFSPAGAHFRLDEIAHIEKGTGPVKLHRENQKNKVSVTANFSGRDLGSIMGDIKAKVAASSLPGGCFVEYGGEAKHMRETFVSIAAMFVLAVLLVYMIMAAQFESLAHPFTVLFTVPLGLTGVALILLLTGNTLSLPSLLGVIIMVGVVVNNGIVLVDYVNQLRARGLSRDEALVRGGAAKLRAIVLTSATTIVGMIPLAVSRTEGSELASPMALAVIGGMVISTFLMLVVIPVVYSVLDDLAARALRRRTDESTV